jgi:sugar diacid utilization regulator
LTSRFAAQVRARRPREAGELSAGVHDCLALAAGVLSEPEPHRGARLGELVGRAVEWAREGIDLDSVLRAFHQTVRYEFGQVAGERSYGADELLAGAEQALRLLETVTVATSAAYLDEHRLAARHHQTAAQTLVTALLSGHGRVTMARRSGIRVAETYQVVALAIPAYPGDRQPRAEQDAAARRKLRRVQSALAPVLGSRALSVLSVDGGIVLVPVEESAAASPRPVVRVTAPTLTADTFDVLAAAVGVPLTAAVVTGPTDRIPDLAEQAYELLELVRALRRPPGLYQLADVAVEYQLTRPGPAREHLVALLAPLAPHPELLDTLRIYLDTGLDRKAAARQLDLHPNSVSHRVRRIERLVGVDLGHPAGISRASLALLAHDLATAALYKKDV